MRQLPAQWQRAGHATGAIRCQVILPASDTRIDMRCQQTPHAFRYACRFIERHLPSASHARTDASFTISAEFRAASGGTRWRVVCRWRAGEPVEAAIQEATALWKRIPKEEKVWPVLR
jgi:hypothetical protein